MNDEPTKRFRITLDVDARVSEIRTSQRNRRERFHIGVNVEVEEFDYDNPKFKLSDANGGHFVIPWKNGQAIDLRSLTSHPIVLIAFNLMNPELHFPDKAINAMGIHVGDGSCPRIPTNEDRDQVRRESVSSDGRQLILLHRNCNRNNHRFALFLYRNGDVRPALCDPHIINK